MALRLPLLRTATVVLAAVVCSSSPAAAAPTKASRIQGAFFGTLVADALCLGSHYEYDAKKIKKAYGGQTIDRYLAAGERMGGQTHGVGWGARNYHPGTKAGDQTDYGEYNVVVLEHLYQQRANAHPFKVEEMIPMWKNRLKTWKQWMCTQTKQTKSQLDRGTPVSQVGGMSNAMALRAASAYAYYADEASIVDATRKAMFTHRNDQALGGGDFYAKVTYRVIHKGMTPKEAILSVKPEMNGWFQTKIQQGLDKVAEATNPAKSLSKEEFVDDLALTSMARLWDVGKSEPIKVGKASPTEGTLPGSIYFIVKYMDDFEAAVKANAMVGGDNASRATAIGMVLGAYHGVEAIPETLQTSLNHWKHAEGMITELPFLKSVLAGNAEL